MAKSSLSRKKITVHGRKGTYQRSVMVRSTATKKPGRIARLFTGKTGAATNFRIGLATGAVHGLFARRMEDKLDLAHHAVTTVASHIGAHGIAKAAGQGPKSKLDWVGHRLSHSLGRAVGATAVNLPRMYRAYKDTQAEGHRLTRDIREANAHSTHMIGVLRNRDPNAARAHNIGNSIFRDAKRGR